MSCRYYIFLLGMQICFSQCSATTQPETLITSEKIPDQDTIILLEDELPPDSIDAEAYGLIIKPGSGTYTQARQRTTVLRQKLKPEVIGWDSVGKVFTQQIVNELIPYWYGTTWSFEGHTSVPGEGEVACGYFVSTTLRHAGIKLNLYRLAQQAPLQEALTLALQDSLYRFEDAYDTSIISTSLLPNLAEGLYFVGLSNHVSFLLKTQGETFFLHSNYMDPPEVVIQRAITSEAFNYSDTYYVVPLSNNQELMKRWLQQDTIEVITE